jgi:DGQHR domain-containing protein
MLTLPIQPATISIRSTRAQQTGAFLVNTDNANINLIECSDYADLMHKVGQHGLASNVQIMPGTLYEQGGRICLQTAITLAAVTSFAEAHRPDSKGVISVDQVKASSNRPLDKQHASAIAGYISNASTNKSPYIIPSLTLNVTQKVDVMVVRGASKTRPAVLVMPVGVKAEITDGQHRVAGVEMALRNARDAGEDAIGAMITFTNDHGQTHQDFADCAKTKAISPSTLAVYDRRNPANGLVLDLVENCPLFQSTVDATKQSISARSTAVWTTNNIRVMLKWALIGKQSSDSVFAENAVNVLGERGTDAYNEWLSALTVSLNIMTEGNKTLADLAALEGDRLSMVPTIREQHNLLMTGAGLAVFGRLWFLIRDLKMRDPGTDTEMLVRRVAAMDWTAPVETNANGAKYCANPLFAQNLKINPERTQTGAKYINEAADQIWQSVVGMGALAA